MRIRQFGGSQVPGFQQGQQPGSDLLVLIRTFRQFAEGQSIEPIDPLDSHGSPVDGCKPVAQEGQLLLREEIGKLSLHSKKIVSAQAQPGIERLHAVGWLSETPRRSLCEKALRNCSSPPLITRAHCQHPVFRHALLRVGLHLSQQTLEDLGTVKGLRPNDSPSQTKGVAEELPAKLGAAGG